MIVREEAAGDEAAIGAVVAAAFREVARSRQTEAAIVAALRAAGALSLSLVAVREAAEGAAVLGHAAFSPVTVDGRAGGWVGLGPLAVRPDMQRRGIGAALVRAGLGRLAARGAGGCVVLGNPAYYGRFGFRAVEGLVLPGVPAAHFMALPLAGAVPRGAVAYHAGFAAGG